MRPIQRVSPLECENRPETSGLSTAPAFNADLERQAVEHRRPEF